MTTLQDITETDLASLIDYELSRAARKAEHTGVQIATGHNMGARRTYAFGLDYSTWRVEIVTGIDYLGRHTVQIAAGDGKRDDAWDATEQLDWNSPSYFKISHEAGIPTDVLRASIRGVLRYQRLEALDEDSGRIAAEVARQADIDMDASEPDEDRDSAPLSGPYGPSEELDSLVNQAGIGSRTSGPLTPITDPEELERIHQGIADGTIKELVPVDPAEEAKVGTAAESNASWFARFQASRGR